eukprot:3208452-Pyramimonas_sp.AAC.1
MRFVLILLLLHPRGVVSSHVVAIRLIGPPHPPPPTHPPVLVVPSPRPRSTPGAPGLGPARPSSA